MEAVALRSGRAKIWAGVLVALLLGGCGGYFKTNPPEIATRASYVHDGPPEIALITTIHKPTNFMWHSALLINADERVLFESGGFWDDPEDRRLNDVHYNLTDARLVDYAKHRGESPNWDYILHRVPVTAEVAQLAKERAITQTLVMAGFCALGVRDVLREVPGFEHMDIVVIPEDLVGYFAKMPGVTMEHILPPTRP